MQRPHIRPWGLHLHSDRVHQGGQLATYIMCITHTLAAMAVWWVPTAWGRRAYPRPAAMIKSTIPRRDRKIKPRKINLVRCADWSRATVCSDYALRRMDLYGAPALGSNHLIMAKAFVCRAADCERRFYDVTQMRNAFSLQANLIKIWALFGTFVIYVVVRTRRFEGISVPRVD
jgi:hypothetical protein